MRRLAFNFQIQENRKSRYYIEIKNLSKLQDFRIQELPSAMIAEEHAITIS